MLRESNLKGFTIPGLEDRILTSLFADDTTVFLSVNDNYNTLQGIHDLWCLAARAKFNVNKTEIIPVGNRDYRATVVETRKFGLPEFSFGQEIKIAGDGVPTRNLGAWVGNNVNQAIP